MGELHVLDGDVILQVEPFAPLAFGDMPQRRKVVGAILCFGAGQRRCAEAKRVEGGHGAVDAGLQRGGGGELARCCPGDTHALRQVLAGNKAGDMIVPDRAAALVTGERDIGVPAAGDTERGAAQIFGATIGAPQGDAGEAQFAGGVDDLCAREERVVAKGRDGCGGAGSAVDHADNIHSQRGEIACRAVTVVIVGEDRNALPRRHRPAIAIGAQGARHHHTGAVVVLEGDLAFGGACTEDALTGVDPPQRLARQVRRGRGKVIGIAFKRAVNPVIKGTQHGGAAHQAHVRTALQLCCGLRRPICAGLTVDLLDFGVEAAPKGAIFIGEDHPRAAARRCQGGG